MQIINDRPEWKRQQDLHKASQMHAEWAAKQMLKRLRSMITIFGVTEGIENFRYVTPVFVKAYRIKAEHWEYAKELVEKQIKTLTGGKA